MDKEILEKYECKKRKIENDIIERNKDKLLDLVNKKVKNIDSDFWENGNTNESDCIFLLMEPFLLESEDFENYNINLCSTLESEINTELVLMYLELLESKGYYCGFGYRSLYIYKSKKIKYIYELRSWFKKNLDILSDILFIAIGLILILFFIIYLRTN